MIGKTVTSILTKDGYTSIIYHDTEVVKFSDSEIILDTGGWFTATTKKLTHQL